MKGNKKQSIILFHGLTGNPSELFRLKRNLEKKGYICKTPLLPGHGSRFDELKQYGIIDLVEFCKTFVKNESRKNRIEVLGGLSMGALLATKCILDLKLDIKALLLMAPAFRLNRIARLYINILKRLDTNTLRKIFIYKGPSTWSIYRRGVYTKVPAHLLLDLSLLSESILRDSFKIQTPVLIFHSQNDPTAEIKATEEFYNNIGSKKKHFITLDRAGHCISDTLYAEDIVENLVNFLDYLKDPVGS